ncbi:DUF1499 domain-containing protein [Salinisphaera aquimarina]|uniref:DUF1499 domain-containing protein n=1 Tax=Salinisphaera aquimarina TaxID=2094031 RepID=A0ABV7ELU4_9GAMM
MLRTIFKPVTAVIVLTAGVVGCASSPPEQFTRSDNDFTPCSSAPHCVSSQAEKDSGHYVEPFAFAGTADGARQALLKALYSHDNATVEQADNRFIHATFRSTLGFVDDATFVVQPHDHIIDVKSSSRIGYYDFGVNRRRVEDLRKRFKAELAGA